MENQAEIINLTILRQREALYKIRNDSDVSRTDLELLVFAVEKVFFSYYDIEKYFSHTNCQQLRRSLKRLEILRYVRALSKGVKNNATTYAVLTSGKQLLTKYQEAILLEKFS